MSGTSSDIIITGAGLITALGLTRQQTWEAVCAGRCGMGRLSAMEQALLAGQDGGQAVELPADFEPHLPREVRYLRRAISDALSEAGINSDSVYPPDRCAVMVGTTLHGMRAGGQFLRDERVDHLKSFLAGHTLDQAISELWFEGMAATTCSACSSSLGSIALGITMLQSGQCDLVVAGGYDTISEYVYAGFNSLRLVAEGALRPFSCNRKGMKLAEGYGIVVLERADDVLRRGGKPLALVAGWGESADAHHLTQPHPQGAGAARAIRQAIERASLNAERIDFVAAHATGTIDNDAAEHAALAEVFGSRLADAPVVGFKSHLGHTLGGAGAVELILSMMVLKHQTVPPCANVEAAEVAFSDMRLATGSAVNAPIRATLNTSLGFGGANTSVVLTEPPRPSRTSRLQAREVVISGIGVVFPGVFSNEALLEHLIRPQAPAWERSWGPVADAELEGLLNARRVRRMSDYVKLQLAAATLACRDARISDLPAFAQTTSAILGTMHGSAGYSLNYYTQVVREGIGAANPMLFAEGVPNAGAAQLSLMLGLKGACQTIIGTRTAVLDALNLAAARIATGSWDRAIVGAGEEQCEIIQRAYEHCGLAARGSATGAWVGEGGFVCSGGAVAFVLESRASIEERQGPARARIVQCAAAKSRRETLPRVTAQILEELGPVDVVISSANATWVDHAEAAAIRRANHHGLVWTPYGHAPELFSASPLLGLAAVVLGRRVPPPLAPLPATCDWRTSTGSESPATLCTIASDFSGGVAGAKVQLL